MTSSLMFPVAPDGHRMLVEFARFAKAQGARRLWTGTSLAVDTYSALAAAATAVPHLPLGTAVALTPLQHPYRAAVEARGIAALSGEAFVAGYGPGSVDLQAGTMAAAYRSPLRATEEYVRIVRTLLDGEPVAHQSEYFTAMGRLLPMAAPPVEIGVGVLRAGMARTAGRVADVAVTWLTPHWYLRDVLSPALAEGAAGAGRKSPRLVAVVHVAVARPARNLRRTVLAAVGPHLSAAHYTDMLRRAGVEVDRRDPVKGAETLLDAKVFVTGTPAEIAEELRRYRAAGVDEVVLNVGGVYATEGEAAALRDLRDVAGAERG